MSTEAQRVDDSPSTSGGSSDGDQRESVQQEPEREQVQPKKKEGKISSKTAAKLSTSAKRIQKELAEITLDPPPNCRGGPTGWRHSFYLTPFSEPQPHNGEGPTSAKAPHGDPSPSEEMYP
uniref:Ubiquitin conjugating enzyme E2 E2 n=1 Tax=Ailuropoda melanoleuca TaxID=9646 RepID=A0A7N5JK20_AILME